MDKLVKCIMVGYSDDHSGDMYHMYDPVMNTVRNMQDVYWAVWMHTDPTKTMQILTGGTRAMAMAGNWMMTCYLQLWSILMTTRMTNLTPMIKWGGKLPLTIRSPKKAMMLFQQGG